MSCLRRGSEARGTLQGGLHCSPPCSTSTVYTSPFRIMFISHFRQACMHCDPHSGHIVTTTLLPVKLTRKSPHTLGQAVSNFSSASAKRSFKPRPSSSSRCCDSDLQGNDCHLLVPSLLPLYYRDQTITQ